MSDLAVMARLKQRSKFRLAAVIEWTKGLAVFVLVVAAAAGIQDGAESRLLEVLSHTAWLGGAAAREVLAKALQDFHAWQHWAFAGAGLYISVRVMEGIGLWLQREWARWLGIAGASLYLPLEALAGWRDPGWLAASALCFTLLLIALLWPPRRPDNAARLAALTRPSKET